MVKNLIPNPSEGKVRAKFGGENIHYPPSVKKLPKLDSRSTLHFESKVYNSVSRPNGHKLLGAHSSNMKDDLYMPKQSLFQRILRHLPPLN